MAMALVALAMVGFLVSPAQAAGTTEGLDGEKVAQKLTRKAPEVGTCGVMKQAYKRFACCGMPEKVTNMMLVPMNAHMSQTPNPCKDKKKMTSPALDNKECWKDGVLDALEQSGTNVTAGFKGDLVTTAVPITTSYFKAGLCPVNVHWHLGTEHYSIGQYDETGMGPDVASHFVPADSAGNDRRLAGRHDRTDERRLAESALLGFRCKHYDANDPRFADNYVWQHCADMHVGETYEIHWPHSTLGACQTPNQFQSPFYDGVFCNAPDNLLTLVGDGTVKTYENIGVQAQIFTIINDEQYYHPDLMRHAIVDGHHWVDVAYYTGSTTGTSRNNQMCSSYAPITWQVDRTCHLISASSFDKMCADMKAQHDDMTGDIFPHGARTLVWANLTANNHQRRM